MTLTDVGRRYALAAAEHGSTLARVALAGRGEWPDAHVDSSIGICNERGREIAVEAAFLAAYEDPEWGLKASEEDALLAILQSVRPDLGLTEDADGIDAIRNDVRLSLLAADLYGLMCAGLDSGQIAKHILPRIDGVLA